MSSVHDSKVRLLDATLRVVRAKGYNASRIEDICSQAGLTKGSFFHHFKSKEDLALAAIAYWDASTERTFAEAPYHDAAGPLARLIAYVDFRKAILLGDLPDFTCFVGTILQEAYLTHPEVSAACEQNLSRHSLSLVADIEAARLEHGVGGGWSAEGLALHIQAVLQGGFILAKAKGGAAVAADCIDHLKRYLELLFGSAEHANGSPSHH